MDNNAVYDKSDKGREEIVTRKHRLAPRLRSLLVMVDGKRNVGELLQQVAGLGLDQDSLNELYEGQFIEPSTSPVAVLRPALPETTSAPERQSGATQATTLEQALAQVQGAVGQSGPANSGIGPNPVSAAQILALQAFFNTTIKSTLGLRGFTLQLKVERAANLEDFRNLRQTYVDAITKAKGAQVVGPLREQLDQLLREAEQSTWG